MEAKGRGESARQLVVLDTSVLLNFLRVGRLDLLVELPGHEFLVTDHVRGEVTDASSSRMLFEALEAKRLREERVDTPAELAAFARLITVRTLGLGECAALAVAVCRGLAIAIDDRAARKRAKETFGFRHFVGTTDLGVAAMQAGLINAAVTEELKRRGKSELRFELPLGSLTAPARIN